MDDEIPEVTTTPPEPWVPTPSEILHAPEVTDEEATQEELLGESSADDSHEEQASINVPTDEARPSSGRIYGTPPPSRTDSYETEYTTGVQRNQANRPRSNPRRNRHKRPPRTKHPRYFRRRIKGRCRSDVPALSHRWEKA